MLIVAAVGMTMFLPQTITFIKEKKVLLIMPTFNM